MSRFKPVQTTLPRYGSPLGLPAAAMVLSNSDRKAGWCDQRWFWERGLSLQSSGGQALYFGAAFDKVMEGLLCWYRDHPGERMPVAQLNACECGSACERCGYTGKGPLARVVEEMRATPDAFNKDGESVEDEIDRLTGIVNAWHTVRDADMAEKWTILASQLEIAAPVCNDKGQTYRSRVPVVEVSNGWRLADARDDPATVQLVMLPWWQVMKLDGLAVNNQDGNLYVWETKTSADPEKYGRDLPLDTQLPGYMRGVLYALHKGLLSELVGDRELAGAVWDVSTNKPLRDEPKRLKSGKLSTDSRQRIPSWVLAPILDAEDASKYTADELASLRDLLRAAREKVDPSIFHREYPDLNMDDLRRFELELLTDAEKFAAMHRNAVGIEHGKKREAMYRHFPRVPHCRQPGGKCPFTGLCLTNEPDASAYTKREPILWLKSVSPKGA